jgi:hypothetical protein
MEKFILILGEESSYLPGKMWTQYEVEVLDDTMVCTNKKDSSISNQSTEYMIKEQNNKLLLRVMGVDSLERAYNIVNQMKKAVYTC